MLRIYEFHHLKDHKITDKLHGGQKPKIIIDGKNFHQFEILQIKKLLPEFTLARKEKLNNLAEDLKIQTRKLAHSLESEKISPKKYQEKRKKYFQALEVLDQENNDQIKSTKTPRIGKEGCCGKGCNGCLIFWHDEKYHKARQILKTKKIGEML